MIERVGLKEEAQILLPAIANRLNKTPFPEPCKLDDWLIKLQLKKFVSLLSIF